MQNPKLQITSYDMLLSVHALHVTVFLFTIYSYLTPLKYQIINLWVFLKPHYNFIIIAICAVLKDEGTEGWYNAIDMS